MIWGVSLTQRAPLSLEPSWLQSEVIRSQGDPATVSASVPCPRCKELSRKESLAPLILQLAQLPLPEHWLGAGTLIWASPHTL